MSKKGDHHAFKQPQYAKLHRSSDLKTALFAVNARPSRLAAHPQALNAVLQTARALRRTPDAVSVREVADWSCSD